MMVSTITARAAMSTNSLIFMKYLKLKFQNKIYLTFSKIAYILIYFIDNIVMWVFLKK